MDDGMIIDIIYATNKLFEKEWEKDCIIKPDAYELEETVKDIFTNGGCALYGEYLYDILKDFGAELGKSNDHVFVRINDKYYDAVSGYEPNSNLLKTLAEKNGFLVYDLETKEGKEQFEYYKNSICKVYSIPSFKEASKILNGIKEVMKKRIDDKIKNSSITLK